MTKIKRYPKVFEFAGESVKVLVQFFRNDEGLERAEVAVLSKALPDERQIVIKHDRYADGHVLTAVQSAKLPKKRPADPMPTGTEIGREDLQGKYLVLNQKYFKGTLAQRVIQASGGFGCNVDGIGRKLFGRFVYDGSDFAGRREDASRYATDAEVKVAKADG